MPGKKAKKSVDKRQNKRIADLEHALVPELKSFGAGTADVALTGTFTLQYQPLIMAQGITSITRVGLEYAVHGLDLRFRFGNTSPGAHQFAQFWVIQDMGNNGAQLTDAEMRYNVASAQLNAYSGWNDNRIAVKGFHNKLLNLTGQNRIKIVYDSGLLNLSPFDHTATQTYQDVESSRLFHKRLRFKTPKVCKALGVGATIASAGPGVLQLVWAGESNLVYSGFGCITYFTDA